MSKYIVFAKHKKDGNIGMLYHTKTKYTNNEPYVSSTISQNAINFYAVELNVIDALLKIGHSMRTYKGKKYSKIYKFFVLKSNSPKIKKLISSK